MRLVRGQLLGMPEGELLALEPETRMEGIVFRALSAPGSGFPDEGGRSRHRGWKKKLSKSTR